MALRLRLFRSASEELRAVIEPPWPQWMRRLYELEGVEDPGIDVDAAVITPSAAVSALGERLRNRLGLVSWTAGVLQELGWEITQDGDSLMASCKSTPDEARASLEHRRGRRDVSRRHRRERMAAPGVEWRRIAACRLISDRERNGAS